MKNSSGDGSEDLTSHETTRGDSHCVKYNKSGVGDGSDTHADKQSSTAVCTTKPQYISIKFTYMSWPKPVMRGLYQA